MSENIDVQLLNRDIVEEGEEQQTAGSLRRNKRSRNQQKEEQPQTQEGKSKPRSLRQQLMDTQRQGIKGKAESEAKKQVKEKMASPVKMQTNRMLRQAWLWLIPSFGLSLIYIYLHVFMHFVSPDVFCDLGEEWNLGSAAADESESGAMSSGGAKIVEWGMLIFVSIAVGAVLFTAFGFLYLLTDIIKNPIESLWTYGIKPIAEIIKNMLSS